MLERSLTYEARKSTPAGLGSCRKLRECKSVANTVCKIEDINVTNPLCTHRNEGIYASLKK